jgi:hypothetical protein
MADPIFGEGSAMAVNDGANSAFVDFDDVTDITLPTEAQVTADRNRLSATTLVETAFSTRRDPGTLTFTYENGFSKYDRIEDLRDDTPDPSWRFTAADGNLRLTFSGRVISNAPTQVQGGVVTMATCTVRLTSLVTVADASP